MSIFKNVLLKLIIAAGKAEKYLTKEKISQYGLDGDDILSLIKATGNIEKYLDPKVISQYGLSRYNILNLIKTTGRIEEYLEPEVISQYGLDIRDILNLIKATGNIEKYLEIEAISKYGFKLIDIKDLIIATGKIEEYLKPEVISQYVLKLRDGSYEFFIADLIKATGKIEKYLEPETILKYRLQSNGITEIIKATGNIEKYLFEGQDKNSWLGMANVIKATGKIEEYLEPEISRKYGLYSDDITRLIKATGNIEKYLFEGQDENSRLTINNLILTKIREGKCLTPEMVLQCGLQPNDIKLLIQETGDIEKCLFECQSKNSRLSIANVIKATGNIEEYLKPEIIYRYRLNSDDITRLIKATGKIEKYLIEGQDENSNLSIANIIKATGEIDKYLDLEIIFQYGLADMLRSNDIRMLIRAKGNIEEYLFEWQDENSNLSIANLIKATGNIEHYLNPEIVSKYGLHSSDIVYLIKATGNIEQYLKPEILSKYRLYTSDIAFLIKETGNIEQYLNPEIVSEYGLSASEIAFLIKETGNIGEYLFEWQDENSNLSIANVIKATGNIEQYLNLEIVSKYGLNSSDRATLIRATGNIEQYLKPEIVSKYGLNSSDIVYLIKATGNIEQYLKPEILSKYGLMSSDIATLIRATGNIEQYLKPDKLEYLNIDNSTIIKLIKEINLYPELEESDFELLRGFNEREITTIIINLEEGKKKSTIKILHRLSESNSAELRRIKIQVALQILEREPEKYEEILHKIEEIYLTNNIPTVGKLYLVFKELHPNFFGEENRDRKDDSYGLIPSLEAVEPKERKNIIFSNLLRCALESNSRNIREYLGIIEKGNILYEQLLSGELKLDELDSKDEKVQILSAYRDILNALYNVTSKGKRKETPRKNSGNLKDDLEELDSLFREDLIDMNLPDRIIRTFAYGTGIRTFEQAKDIIENIRKNAHSRNVEAARNGKIQLKQGDFVKGVADTQYFSFMLQRGILAKDFLGGNAKSDGTPLDTDVEKVLKQGLSFEETLGYLYIAQSFTNSQTAGKNLGTIMLVFSGDDFIETRDSSGKINEKNLKSLRRNNDKKEVFCNNGSAYGIPVGIGATRIKYIIADRYVDKLGVEIAKNGFYIPIVDRVGNIIFTESMYKELCAKMQGLAHYGEYEFKVDETARNEGTSMIAKLVDKIREDSLSKRNKILEILKEAVEQNGYILSPERKVDLTPGFIEFIDTGSTGRGTNVPGDGDFDFIVRMDRDLSDVPEKFKESLRRVLGKRKPPKKSEETAYGDFRYKGVAIDGLDKEVDIDLTFTERTDEIEYSTDECIKERLETIKKRSIEDYRYVVANILLAKKLLKQAKVYKKSNAPEPEKGEPDVRGGLGAVGIENWVLQNGGSFYKAAESFLKAAKESKDFEEFKRKYAIWDFGENYMSTEKDIYAHDNFVYNMNESGYERMKEALARYIEAVQKENLKRDKKIRIADIIYQDTSVIEDTPYMIAVNAILERGEELLRVE